MNYARSAVRKIVSEYLESVDQQDTPVLGKKQDQAAINAAAPAMLSSLQQSQASARLIIIVAVILLCALFIVGIALVFYYRDLPGTITFIFGGNFFSLLIVVFWLRRLWLEKTTIDTLLVLVSKLPPEEAAKIIVSFHFKSIGVLTAQEN